MSDVIRDALACIGALVLCGGVIWVIGASGWGAGYMAGYRAARRQYDPKLKAQP